jgi:hypothetical protein
MISKLNKRITNSEAKINFKSSECTQEKESKLLFREMLKKFEEKQKNIYPRDAKLKRNEENNKDNPEM